MENNKPSLWRCCITRIRRSHPAYQVCVPLSALALAFGYAGQPAYTASWYAMADKYDTTPQVEIVTGLQPPRIHFYQTDTHVIKGVKIGGHYVAYWTAAESDNWYLLHPHHSLCPAVLGDYSAALQARYGGARLESLIRTATAEQGRPVGLLVSVPRFADSPDIPAECPDLTYEPKSGVLLYGTRKVAYLLNGNAQQTKNISHRQ